MDELGYLPLAPDAAHLFVEETVHWTVSWSSSLQLVSRRDERGAMLVTSNRPVGE